MSKRMTIEISDAMDKALDQIMEDFEITTKIEVIRNAFVVYKLLLDEMSKGYKIAIADKDNHIIKEIVMSI